MTDTPTQRVEQDGSQDSLAHDWHIIDSLNGIECKRHGLDTYELKTKDGYHITVNQEGFDAYRINQSKFIAWITSNNLKWIRNELES